LTRFPSWAENRRSDAAGGAAQEDQVMHFKRALLVLLALCSTAAAAHHSTANFDRTKSATVTGKVTYFGFTNPHSFIDLEVVDSASGKARPFKVFLPGRVLLSRYDWKPGDLKTGDMVTLAGYPDRKDATFMYMTRIRFASGKDWVRSEQIPE
jgi:hypothetical protein